MAINNAVRYPANSTPPDAAYPFGSAKNSSAPGAKNGYPWEKDQINDWLGFTQGLLNEANITPSGNPDTVLISQHMDALKVIHPTRLKSNITVKVPDDFATLQEALDDSINRFKNEQGIGVTINIETGHVLTAGFRIDSCDASFITITSTDAIVTVSPTFIYVSNTDLDDAIPRTALLGFLAVKSKMPNWNTVVDVSARVGMITGYELDHGSFGYILPTKGVINISAGGPLVGTNVRITTGSHVVASSTNMSGAAGECIQFTANAFGVVASADCSNAGNTGVDISRASVVYANSVNCDGAGSEGIYCRRSWLNCQSAILTNCLIGAAAGIGSVISATDADFTGSSLAVQCDDGSHVDVSKATGITGGAILPTEINLTAFNRLEGDGMVTNSLWVNGSVDYVDSQTAITSVGGDLIAVASLTFSTILNLAGQHKLHSGIIYGQDVGIKITIDGVVVLDDQGRFRGDDSAANQYSSVSIPALVSQTSMLVEMFNRAGAISNLGFRLYHT